jgi:hypothetical protein
MAYSSLHRFWPLALLGEPSKRTTEWRKHIYKKILAVIGQNYFAKELIPQLYQILTGK